MFSSLLKDVDGRVGYNADDPTRDDAHVQRKFTFAGKPKKNVVSTRLTLKWPLALQLKSYFKLEILCLTLSVAASGLFM